jgi:hypothetical protein
MMPAQLALVASAALPPLPTTREFLERLAEVNRPKTDDGRAELCLAPALQEVEVAKLPNGTIHSRKQAYKAACDFQKVVEIQHKEHTLQNLDDWFTAFAVFTLAVETLTDDKALHPKALEERKNLCAAAGVMLRQWSPQTLKTNGNSLCALYRTADGAAGLCLSCSTTFPKFNTYFTSATRRYGMKKMSEKCP